MSNAVTNAEIPHAKPLLKDTAYESIKQQILKEELPSGAFLSERKLAQALGIGLTPVRQALQRLSDEGFVRISPRQGAYVTDMSVDEILDVYEIRRVLETFVVGKIAGKLSRDQIGQLEAVLAAQRAASAANDVEAIVRNDMEFHHLLCEFCGNAEIQRVMQRLRDKVYRIIVRSVRLQSSRTVVSIQEHANVLDAVARGDVEQAVEWMGTHMEFGKRFVLLR